MSPDFWPEESESAQQELATLLQERAKSAVAPPTSFESGSLRVQAGLPHPIPRCGSGMDVGRWHSMDGPRLDWENAALFREIDVGAPRLYEALRRCERVGKTTPPPAISPAAAVACDVGDAARVLAQGLLQRDTIESSKGIYFASVLLAYIFGTERAWRLRSRADLELAVRLPPLLGMTGRGALERILELLLERRGVRVVEAPLQTEERSRIDGSRPEVSLREPVGNAVKRAATRAFPPLAGSWRLVSPTLTVVLGRAHQGQVGIAQEYGYERRDGAVIADADAAMVRDVVRQYVAPHVFIQVSGG
jgi:hypothetical protein